jgi:hypothetical protein
MNQLSVLFVPETPLMLRTPLLPIEAMLPLLDTPWESTHHWRDDRELVDAFANDLETMHQWLLRVLEHSPYAASIREALLVGSPDLAHALPRLQQRNSSHKRTQKTAINLFRYLLRMTLRSTPFGLFAGVTTGQVDQQTNVHLKAMQAYHTRTRVDMQWLFTLICQIEQDASYADYLRWMPNPLLWRSGTRLVLPYAHQREQEQADTLSLRATPQALTILELARTGKTRQDLKRQLLTIYPDQRDLSMQIDQLCEADILVSELRPPLTDVQPLDALFNHLSASCVPPGSPLYEAISEVSTACKDYDELPPGQGETMLRTLFEQPHASLLPPLRLATDLHTVCATATLSSRVADDIALAAQLLLRLSPHPPFPIELQTYHRLFVEKYGLMRQVPLPLSPTETLF